MYHLTSRWTGDLSFESEIQGFTVVNDDLSIEEGGKGPSPKRMMLASLVACTGMDVVSILQKMRVKFSAFRIEAESPITEEHPKTFVSVHLKYILEGEEIKREKVERAVELSQEKYCGVSAMLRKHCPITWEIELISI